MNDTKEQFVALLRADATLLTLLGGEDAIVHGYQTSPRGTKGLAYWQGPGEGDIQVQPPSQQAPGETFTTQIWASDRGTVEAIYKQLYDVLNHARPTAGVGHRWHAHVIIPVPGGGDEFETGDNVCQKISEWRIPWVARVAT